MKMGLLSRSQLMIRSPFIPYNILYIQNQNTFNLNKNIYFFQKVIPANMAKNRGSGLQQPALLQGDHAVGQEAHVARMVADEEDTQAQAQE